jgi:hypothetical protein
MERPRAVGARRTDTPATIDGKPAQVGSKIAYNWVIDGPSEGDLKAALKQATRGAERGDPAA